MNTEFDEVTWVADRLPEVDEPEGVATDRARLALLEHVSAATGHRRRPRRLGLRLAATGVAAAAVAGVCVSLIGGPGAPAPASRTAPVTPIAIGVSHHRLSGHPVLLQLADDVTQAPAPPGNATLVRRTQHYPNQPSYAGYDLYEDGGTYFFGQTLAALHQAVTSARNGDRQLGGVLAAAARSANLSPAQAASNLYHASPAPPITRASIIQTRSILRQKLASSGPSAASRADLQRALRRLPRSLPPAGARPQPPSQATVDNYLWMNAMNALEGGGGQADIRAGAMLALSTLPDVTVTRTQLSGQAVVQVTNTEFPSHYHETLDLDAQTGVLVRMSGGTIGGPDAVDVTYETTRVTAPSLDTAH